MLINLISKKNSTITTTEINRICKLKETHWKFGFRSQIEWFKKNIKKNDIHNLLYLNNILIGYTCLRNRKCLINNIMSDYLLFYTLIINKKYRNKKYSNILMDFNNNIIKKNKKISFLICKKKLVKFYKKNKWHLIENKIFKVIGYEFKTFGMVYNINKNHLKKKNNYVFFVNKSLNLKKGSLKN